MDTAGVVVAGVVVGGIAAFAPLLATRIGDARYGEGTTGHDPEDLAFAPLRSLEGRPVQAVSALVGAGTAAALASQYQSAEVVAVLSGLALTVLVACLVDLRYLRLPNVLTYGGAIGVLAAIAAVSIHLDVSDTIRGAVIGALVYAGFLFVVSELFRLVRGRTGMGLGDVKLALSLGATLGWVGFDPVLPTLGPIRYVIYGALIGNVLGAVGGLALTRFRPDRQFPFGPFLAIGWLVTLVLQPLS